MLNVVVVGEKQKGASSMEEYLGRFLNVPGENWVATCLEKGYLKVLLAAETSLIA